MPCQIWNAKHVPIGSIVHASLNGSRAAERVNAFFANNLGVAQKFNLPQYLKFAIIELHFE
jgi:hypothetical protein